MKFSKNFSKKLFNIISFLMVFVLLFSLPAPTYASAKTDGYIFSDPVTFRYFGRPEATKLIANLSFGDLPADPFERDAIVRSGVLNMIKAYERNYNPGETVTKEGAIAFALRAVGMEDAAQATGVAQLATLPADSPLRSVWSIGYLTLAQTMGLITAADYASAIAQTPVAPAEGQALFVRSDPATREEMADWLVKALEFAQPAIFATTATQQAIYNYNDWESIAPERVNSVEKLLRENIMPGSGGLFDPKGGVTKLETAKILRNMDNIHYNLVGLEKVTGTVAGIQDGNAFTTAAGQGVREIYVRDRDGLVTVLQYTVNVTSSPQDGSLDAVVLRDNAVGGLLSLQVEDQIEFLIEPATGTVWYVQVTGGLTSATVRGRLSDINVNAGTVTVTDENGKTFAFQMADGLYGYDPAVGGYIKYDNVVRPVTSLPTLALYDIVVTNNIVTALAYVGDPELIPEVRGVVLENNPDLGYITVRDANGGQEVTYNYNTGSLRVQKREFYDMRETIGSIHSLFPDLVYNPLETEMSAIEPGDIVSFRTDPEDYERIVSISAAVNYTTRYGRIREVRDDGRTAEMLMEFDNGGTAWFTVAGGVMVMRGGRPVASNTIQPGDWAHILVNQALIGPGYMLESVKEVLLEGDGHQISSIVKGKLSGINAAQNKLTVQDAQRLTQNGWSDYNQLEQFTVSGNDIEFFYDGEPVNYSYVSNYLSRAGAEVYLALENNYAGDRVRVVSFRTGRDELLNPDTVLSADGNGGFTILSNTGTIATDAGTIVRRNGRLVDGRQIAPPDYATVSLNGGNAAAVVDISPAPATSGVQIARGRVYSVDEGSSFKVQSISLFDGQNWNYTPIQREFVIDYNTLFIDDTGAAMNIGAFIDYTGESVAQNVYTIVTDGSRAARVIGNPYSTRVIRGVVYAADGGSVSLRDVTAYNEQTGQWTPVSRQDASATVTVPANSIVVDHNQVVGVNAIQVGHQLKIFTDSLTENIPADGLNGYIVLVEN